MRRGSRSFAFTKWFTGGKINASYNCLDRHLGTGEERIVGDAPCATRKNKAAIIWEGENFEQRTLTYSQLHRKVSKAADILKSLNKHRRPRCHLHGHDPGTCHCRACLCAHRRYAHRYLRRIFRRNINDRVNDCDASYRHLRWSVPSRNDCPI